MFDTVEEVRRLDLQRFGGGDLRRPHVPRAVADERVVPGIGILVHHDATVVHLDLLTRLEIVEDRHLSAAAEQCAAYLHGGEPTDVHVRDERALEDSVMYAVFSVCPGKCDIPQLDTATGLSSMR